jgi:type IV secretion system protein VirD4
MNEKSKLFVGFEVVKNDKTEKPIAYGGDGHILTIGPTRTGKTRRLLIPNLLLDPYNRSFVVIDIKGEIAALTHEHRTRIGSKVVALDPFGVLAERGVNIPTVGFNPMLMLDPRHRDFSDDAMVIAESLIQVAPNSKEPHFAEAAQDFAAGIVMLSKIHYGANANLSDVRTNIAASAESIEEVARTVEADENMHPAVKNKLAKFINAKEGKEIQSILSTASTQTRALDSVAIAASLAGGSVDFGALKRESHTVYLVLPPDRLLTHAKWLRLVISAAMTAMQKTKPVPGRPDVVFMLDEFPQLGRLQSIETAVSLNAGFGIKVWVAVQNLGQLKDQYGDNWETFPSAGAVTCFSPRDVFTRDYMTKLIGTGTRGLRSISISDGKVSTTDSVQKDDLISTQNWQNMILGEHYALLPTNEGRKTYRLFCPDFTQLPPVLSGAIVPGVAP